MTRKIVSISEHVSFTIMKRIIKPFIIHILPIKTIRPDLLDIAPQNAALIVCSDDSNRYLDIFQYRLVIPFADINSKNGANAITSANAKSIIDFVLSLPKTVTDLYICCTEGISRSPAVAAAFLRMSGREDRVIWNNPYYLPNPLVYKTICREAGLFAPEWYVWILKKRSALGYKFSRKRGNTGNYERWQIIE